MNCLKCKAHILPFTKPIFFFSAPSHRLFPRNLPHNRANAERSAQNHRLPSTPLGGPHQGVPLPNTPRSQVPSHFKNHPSGHQARKLAGQLQLCSENL